MLIDFRDRGREGERARERETERERNIDWLPPVWAQTGD